jgi:hypothetical protein
LPGEASEGQSYGNIRREPEFSFGTVQIVLEIVRGVAIDITMSEDPQLIAQQGASVYTVGSYIEVGGIITIQMMCPFVINKRRVDPGVRSRETMAAFSSHFLDFAQKIIPWLDGETGCFFLRS